MTTSIPISYAFGVLRGEANPPPLAATAPPPLAHNDRFRYLLGTYFVAWANLELLSSYGIRKFLNIKDEEAQVLTAGMEFGRKAVVLKNLIWRSKDSERARFAGRHWPLPKD